MVWDVQYSAATTVLKVIAGPLAVADAYSVNEGSLLTVPAPGILANDTDPDNDPLTAVFVSGVSHGTLALNANGSFTYLPAAGFHGVDSFTYKANDTRFDSNVAIVRITVNAANTAPVAAAGPDQVALEGATVVFNGTGSADGEGDALTYSWLFGDGGTAAGSTPTHVFGDNGTYAVVLTVSDGRLSPARTR